MKDVGNIVRHLYDTVVYKDHLSLEEWNDPSGRTLKKRKLGLK